jgi:hypothetical protein
MKTTRSEAPTPKLIEKIQPFVTNANAMSFDGILFEWLHKAFLQYSQTFRSSAFAPFNGYFATPNEFEESFVEFVTHEISIEGNFIPKATLELVLEQEIVSALEPELIRLRLYSDRVGGGRLNDYIFNLFNALLYLNSERAFALASRALQSGDAFGNMMDAGGRPAPLALCSAIFHGPVIGSEKAGFLNAVVVWCSRNQQRPEVAPFVRRLLPTALASITGDDRATKQVALIDQLLASKNGQKSLMNQIDDILFREGIQLESAKIDCNTVLWQLAEAIEEQFDVGVCNIVNRLEYKTKLIWKKSEILNYIFSENLERGSDSLSELDSNSMIGQLVMTVGQIRGEPLGNSGAPFSTGRGTVGNKWSQKIGSRGRRPEAR